MPNEFVGLWRGPIDHRASSIINAIADEPIAMGSSVRLSTNAIPADELLPRMQQTDVDDELLYGIAVGGDADGVYGDGELPTGINDVTFATKKAGQGIAICTQGRCLARVEGTIIIGDRLSSIGGIEDGALGAFEGATDRVIAIALQVNATGLGVIAVDVQRQVGAA